MAGNVEKFHSPGKGNGLRGTKDFALGEAVTCTQPYVYTACRGNSPRTTVCDHCLCRTEKLLRCSQCKFAKYCNSLCQKNAWKDHKRECLCLKSVFPNIPTDSVRIVARIIFKLLEQPNCSSGEMYTIHDLQSHVDEYNEQMKEGLGHLAVTLKQYLKKELQDYSQLPPGFQILECFGKLTCNSFTISNGEMQQVGVGIYPSISLLNHSCDPNCEIVFEGTCLYLRTVKEIAKGEELTISYIDVKFPAHVRQMQCQNQYCFTCDCHFCLSKYKDEDMLAGNEETSKMMEKSLTTLKELRNQKKEKEALELCKKLINSSQLPDKNIHQLEALDFAMDTCIILEMWEKALQFGLRTLEPYNMYYSNYHPVKAVQMMTVGKLQLHLDMFPQAMDTLQQTFNILKVTHGRDHSLTQAVTELLGDCEVGMKANIGTFRLHSMAP